MRPLLSSLVLLALSISLFAAPPNDNFSARVPLAGSSLNTTGTNVDATLETGENSRNNLFGATVWWSWLAPVSGWARIDTKDSSFDTVIQISTGTTLAGQVMLGFNDESPDVSFVDASSVTFLATAGTTYNIAVGGFDFLGPDMGTIELHIKTGSAVAPPFFPASLTLSPPQVDVTSAPQNVTAAFVIQATGAGGSGTAGIGFGWERRGGDGNFTGQPATWDTTLPQSGSPQVAFTVPRYKAPGNHMVWFKVISGSPPRTVIFSNPDGGSGFALPPAPAVAQSLSVINTGLVDEDPPNLTAFTIVPDNANVTTAPVTLACQATLTDAPAGVESVKVTLRSGTRIKNIVTSLALTSGNSQNGTWTGSITVPLHYPSGNYSALVRATDVAQNDIEYGAFGTFQIPGGNIDVPIVGGSAYETWAYSNWFEPGDPDADVLDDADFDGRPNLLSYAFNLNPHSIADSAGSLPLVELAGTGNARHLRLTFIRRKDLIGSGLTYSPQFTSSVAGVWETVAGGTVTGIDADWERVVIDDTVNVSAERRRFGRLKVDYDAP